jgi:phage gp46-like protein
MSNLSECPDIRLVQNTYFPKYSVTMDWSVRGDGTLDDTQALATAIVVALGTNGLASTDDILPDPDSTDRQGWWGDMDADVIWDAWPIGSLLWLLRRAKITPADSYEGSTLGRVRNYIYAAIQPFVNEKVCSTYSVDVWRQDVQQIDALIRIYRGPLLAIELRYQLLWDELQAVSG